MGGGGYVLLIYAPFQGFYKYKTDFSQGAWEFFKRRQEYVVG